MVLFGESATKYIYNILYQPHNKNRIKPRWHIYLATLINLFRAYYTIIITTKRHQNKVSPERVHLK